jgi:hypothetical protein
MHVSNVMFLMLLLLQVGPVEANKDEYAQSGA